MVNNEKAEGLPVLCNPADPLTPAVFGVQMADSLRKAEHHREGMGPMRGSNDELCVYTLTTS